MNPETALTLVQLILIAFGITGVAAIYSLLRHVKRSTRRTLDRA